VGTKRSRGPLPSVKSPADKELYVKRVREVFAGVTPRPVVRSDEAGLLTLLVAGDAVAQIGREGFRTLPDGPWQSWRIHRPEACEAMQEAVADIISARDLSNPDRSASEAIAKPKHRSTSAPGGVRDQARVDRTTEPKQVRNALIARGVDARLVNDGVIVRHVGRVNVEPETLAKDQARHFVREQTLPYLTGIERRIRAHLPNNDRVDVAVVKDVIRVTADGHAVATIDRFRIRG
jgi:hypothetical protein